MRTKQEEVDANFEAFTKMFAAIPFEHQGKYALMKDGNILGYYSSAEDARTTAETFINDGIYSIQQVSNAPIELGFFTYAVPVVQL